MELGRCGELSFYVIAVDDTQEPCAHLVPAPVLAAFMAGAEDCEVGPMPEHWSKALSARKRATKALLTNVTV